MKKSLSVLANKIFNTGFFNIITSSAFNKVVNFAYGIALVRVISKAEYGVYSYANNIYSYFALFLGLGVSNALLQVCSEKGNDEVTRVNYYRFCSSFSFYFNIILSALIIISSLFVPMPFDDCNSLLLLMGLLPAFTQYTPIYTSWLRANLRNKEYANLNIVNTAAIAGFSILGAYMEGAKGLVLGRYGASVVTILFALAVEKCPMPEFRIPSGVELEKKHKFRILKIAATLCVSEAVVQIISLIGVLLLGVFVKNEETIASYKSATIIPTSLAFVANSIMIYAYPYFAKNKDNYTWTSKNYKMLMFGISGTSGVIALAGFLLARPIITIVFGNEYLDSVTPFRILMMGFVFNSVFRIPASNLIITQLKLKFSFGVSVLGSILTIVFNILFIPKFSSNGAAIAFVFSTFVVGIVSTFYYVSVINRGKNS